MAPSRKSGGGRMVTLSVNPSKLKNLLNASATSDEARESASPTTAATPKEEEKTLTVSGANEATGSPATSATLPAAQINGEAASDSNPGTPAANGTPAPGTAPADTTGKKKGTKRSAGTANLEAKPRGKPGPKKKPRLEDGTIDPSSTARGAGAHKLGPKANQGAINAGLRALDRSGKPCRKWAKGSFRLKSFTGVVWELERWTAPTRMARPDENGESVGASASSSTNDKEDTQGKSNANSPNPAVNGVTTNGKDVNAQGNDAQDVEMTSAAPSMPTGSPAPAIPAAS